MQFDPFGEPTGPHRKLATGGSQVMQRVGVGAFWTLVVAIVATRVAYFDPGLDGTLRFMAGVVQTVYAALV